MNPIAKRLAQLEEKIMPPDNHVTEIALSIIEPIIGPNDSHERLPDGACKYRVLETRSIPLTQKGISIQ